MAALAASIFAMSCSLYKPKPYIPRNAINKQYLDDVTSPTLIQDYYAKYKDKPAEQVTRRNQILQELITLIDQNYSDFESQYYGYDAKVNFAGDAVNLGLTGVSAVTGTAHLKAVLSAVAVGTTGLKTSYQKNFFDQQTRSAIVEKMRAGRATQLALIQDEKHMKAPIVCPTKGCPTAVDGTAIAPYSLEAGLSDVASYYDAGSIIGALQAISANAGDDQTKAKDAQKVNSKIKQMY